MRLQDHPLHTVIIAISGDTLNAERAADLAIGSIGHLLVTTTEGRDRAVPAHFTQPALEHLTKTLISFTAGRRSLLRAHADYGDIAKRLGADPEEYGPSWPCPSGKIERPATVATAAKTHA